MKHGRHAAPKQHARRERRRVRRADRLTAYDADTIALFHAINKPTEAFARQIVANTLAKTRDIKSALVMAGYLRSLAGAR